LTLIKTEAIALFMLRAGRPRSQHGAGWERERLAHKKQANFANISEIEDPLL